MGDSASLGVGPAKCRSTQTGARIFEFPGAESAVQADIFAAKLREVVVDLAKVARPTKCATLLITDLDDSITKEEVAAKIASIGGCSVEAIKTGNIRTGPGGVGSLWVRCPIVAAKTVISGGRLLVGWSSAAIKVLEDRPLRCFKCYGTGHTSLRCPSSENRVQLCFRCGKEGHKIADCKAKEQHCAVCAASGQPAGHVMGGAKCNPPPKKGKGQVSTRLPASEATPADEDGVMSE